MITIIAPSVAILSALATIWNLQSIRREEREGKQLKAQINAIPAILSLLEHLDKLVGYYISPSDTTRKEVSNYKFEDVSLLVEVAETGSKEHRTMIRGIVGRLQVSQSRFKHHSQANALNLMELFAADNHVQTFPNGQNELETFSNRLYDLLNIYHPFSYLRVLLFEFRKDTTTHPRDTFSKMLWLDLYTKVGEDSMPSFISEEGERSREFSDKVAKLNAPFEKEL